MREPPRLTDEIVRSTLHTHYGLSITQFTFLPIGNDAASFVYRADAFNGASYFLKLRTSQGFSAPSLLIPRFLYKQGIPHIIAPLPTLAGALWVRVDDFAMTLYPFLEARTGTAVGLSDAHWVALGAALRQIHASQLPADLQEIVPRERFVPWRRHLLTDVVARISQPDLADPLQRELIAFWQTRQDEIHRLIERADALGDELRQTPPDSVLCHADIHTWNVLLDADQQMWIVDWDEIMLAPKERDLMFVIGGIARGLVSAHATACFLQGYGPTTIDPRALTYYRYAWAVQEIAAYAEDLFFAPHLSEASRRNSLNAIIDVFEPGNIADMATSSESSALR